MSVHFKSKTNEWETPQELYDFLNKRWKFTLDPCCTKETAKCKKFYTVEDDGLSKSWKDEVVFMNPPYGRDIVKWVKKAFGESCSSGEFKNDGATVVCLVPARTDTQWWQNYVMSANEVWLLEGRLKFQKWHEYEGMYVPKLQETTSAPFPSAIVVFNKKTRRVCYTGWEYTPPQFMPMYKHAWQHPEEFYCDPDKWWKE